MNEEQRDKLLLGIKSGTDLETSCHYAGLSVTDVYRMLERGKTEAEKVSAGSKPIQSERECFDLWESLKTARAEAIVRNVAVIQQAASGGTWQAAAWWLERQAPEQFSKSVADRRAVDKGEPKQIAE
jgi:hypothetical protein